MEICRASGKKEGIVHFSRENGLVFIERSLFVVAREEMENFSNCKHDDGVDW